MFMELVPQALDMIGAFRRKLLIKDLRIHFVSAADSPYSAAMNFGYASAAVGMVLPLIENAFGHGLKNVEKGGVMLLSLQQEQDTVTISVEDNGNSLSDEMLNAMRKSITEEPAGESNGIALANIHRRLQLHFGNRSGLFLERSALGGLNARIRIVAGKEEL